MFGSTILDVAIGLVFVYLLLSLICSAINEGIATVLNKRGLNLFEGIKNLLNDPKFTGLAQQLYSHGLVDGLSQDAADSKKPTRLPSYLPLKTFSLALLDILASRGVAAGLPDYQQIAADRQSDLDAAQNALSKAPGDPNLQKAVADAQTALQKAQNDATQAADAASKHTLAQTAAEAVTGRKDLGNLKTASEALEQALAAGRALAAHHPDPLANIERAIEGLPLGHSREALQVLIGEARRDAEAVGAGIAGAAHQLESLREKVEGWYHDAMDRVGGWYKRWTQWVLLGIATLIIGFSNADSLMVGKRLMRDSALRASIVAAADRAVQNGAANPADNEAARQKLLQDAANLSLPLGWVRTEGDRFAAEQVPGDILGWLLKLVGLVFTLCAVSLGAPFWFDTLSKFTNLRGAGTPPGETKKSAPQPAQK